MSKKKKWKLQQEQVSSPADMPAAVEENLVEFDVWFIMRGEKIPKQHMKEVIKADFMGRGLNDKETMENYDKALEKYGIKLG